MDEEFEKWWHATNHRGGNYARRVWEAAWRAAKGMPPAEGDFPRPGSLFKGADGNFYRILSMPNDKYRVFKENSIGSEYLGEFLTEQAARDACYRLATQGSRP
jgi:hypothetical protein